MAILSKFFRVKEGMDKNKDMLPAEKAAGRKRLKRLLGEEMAKRKARPSVKRQLEKELGLLIADDFPQSLVSYKFHTYLREVSIASNIV